jgi:(p)ppGpp synthase/HD superfamily hydrolase
MLGRELAGRFAEAVAYAAEAHAGQMRKGTEVPYLSHLLSVAALTLEHGGTEVQASAAVLHDVVEDQGGEPRLRDVRDRFGAEVADLVAALSDAAPAAGEAKPPWRERKSAYLRHLGVLVGDGHPAALVSLCDKLHNARSIVADASDPVGPGLAVFDRFSAAPEETAWYYRSLRDTYRHGRLPARVLGDFAGTVVQLECHAQEATGR